jgi:amidase
MNESSMHYESIFTLGRLFQAKQLSPVELTRAMLDRIDQIDGRLNAFATVMEEDAMAAAKKAEAEIFARASRGRLHGVPVAVKDLCFTSGVRTMGGTRALADHVPDFDATVVTNLQAAGAVLLGKLNLTEGAMGGYNPHFDIPKNPWDPDRSCGASSSGSAAATAAGLCFGALGSDTGGSIRSPAAACGIVGLKPTWGRVSRYGVLPLAESLDHIGPMARSVADAACLLHAIAGPDANDPTTLPEALPDLFTGLGREITGTRIGWDDEYETGDVDPELADAVRSAVDVLEELGAEIVEVKVPDLDPYIQAWWTLCSAEAANAHADTYPARKEDYGPWFGEILDRGSRIKGEEYARANNLRAACTGLLRRVFEKIDLLACPSVAQPPPPVTARQLYGPLPKERDPARQRFTVPFNYNGAPTLSVPCGFNSDGLPLSLQLAGKQLSEPLLCRVGHAYESATDWHTRHPPDWPKPGSS